MSNKLNAYMDPAVVAHIDQRGPLEFYHGTFLDITSPITVVFHPGSEHERVWTEAEVEQLIYTIKRKLPFENWEKISAIVKELNGPEPIE